MPLVRVPGQLFDAPVDHGNGRRGRLCFSGGDVVIAGRAGIALGAALLFLAGCAEVRDLGRDLGVVKAEPSRAESRGATAGNKGAEENPAPSNPPPAEKERPPESAKLQHAAQAETPGSPGPPSPGSAGQSTPDPTLTAPRELLTNEHVIKLVRAGLAEGVIIEKIRSTPAKFDLDTDNLIALKQAGVPDRVVEAMLAKSRPGLAGTGPASSGPGPEPVAPPAVSPIVPTLGFGLFGLFASHPVQVKDTVIYVKDGKQIELDFVRGRVKQSGFIVYTSKMVLHDAKAQLRITEERPTFYVGANPTEVFLVRFKPDPEDNDRTLTVGKAQFWGYWTEVKQYIDTDDTIPTDFEKLPSGYYRVMPKKPLAKGEYGFLREGAGRVYDFGRD